MYVALLFYESVTVHFKCLGIQQYCNFCDQIEARCHVFKMPHVTCFFFIICKWYICVIVLCLFYGKCTMVALMSPRVTDVGNKIIFPIYNYHYSSETLCRHHSWPGVFFVGKETSTYKLFCIACQFFLWIDFCFLSTTCNFTFFNLFLSIVWFSTFEFKIFRSFYDNFELILILISSAN